MVKKKFREILICNISFGLHDIDIDAHDFYKWAKKKRRKIVQSNFYLCQLMIMKDRLSQTCNGITSVDGSMKLT